MTKKTITLANGIQIPVLGLGTWQIAEAQAETAVQSAIELGYVHVDTAIAYGNEAGVGRGIKNSGIDRKDIFITSKIPAECKKYEQAKICIEQSLQRLGCEYIDLMLIHAPRPWDEMIGGTKSYNEENIQVWKALEEGYKEGKFRAIGVSNFSIEDIKNIELNCEIRPLVNQICCHAGEVPSDIIDYCQTSNVVVEAYSPIATGRLLKNGNVKEIADKYGVSIARLCIRFALQLGTVALPKSTHYEYIKENSMLDFIISAEDMQLLMSL